MRKDLAEIDAGVIACGEFDPHPRRAGIEDIHRLAGSQNHITLWAVDDAAVADVSAEQIDATTRRRGDAALIFHVAGKRVGREIEPASEKVLVAQVEC